jgi:Protein of unknown function (DUF2917)
MKPVRDVNPVRLPARSVHCVEDGKGLEIPAVGGSVWITQAYDRRDMILTQGQSFMLDRQGLVVIYALEKPAIVVGPAGLIGGAAFPITPERHGAA